MMKYIVAASLMSVGASAYADSLTVTLVTGGNTLTATKTLQPSETARLVAAEKTAYPQTCDTASPPACHASSNAEVFSAFAAGLFAGIQANVLSAERAAAATTAVQAVAPIGGLN